MTVIAEALHSEIPIPLVQSEDQSDQIDPALLAAASAAALQLFEARAQSTSPILEVAHELRRDVQDFILGAYRPRSGFGFHTITEQPLDREVSIEPLQEHCTHALQRLTEIFDAPPDLSPQSLALRAEVNHLISDIETFLLFLHQHESRSDLGMSEVPEVAEEAIGFKHALGQHILRADLIKLGQFSLER